MVKFANKPKGRPSKRRTLKDKYKIERKVKQHNKRVRREARKLKGTGLKHKGIARSDYLPNMFPFKHQILDEAKKALPKTQVIELNLLDKSEYGLINIENKCQYLPKPKDNLVKKYITNLEHALPTVRIVLQVLDARNPQACIDAQFRQKCKNHGIHIISVLTKTDTISQQQFKTSIETIKPHCDILVSFSNDNKRKEQSISDLRNALAAVTPTKANHILVAGKTLTGKHSLITTVAKAARCYQEDPIELLTFKVREDLLLIDAPYKISDQSGNPMFTVPNPVLEDVSLQAQEEQLIRRLVIGQGKDKATLDRDGILEFFSIQDFTSVSDFLAKVGRAGKHFGKGGSIDTARVRTKVISDWFCGRLNSFLKN